MNAVKSWLIHLRIALGDNPNHAIIPTNRIVDELDSALPGNAQGRDEHRVNHALSKRQNADLVGHDWLSLFLGHHVVNLRRWLLKFRYLLFDR